jgi:hypothetical protein
MIDICPYLRCLSLIEVMGIRDDEWALVSESLAGRLKHFAITDCSDAPMKYLHPIIPSLEELTILYQCSPLTETLSNLGPNIRNLTIKYCEESNIEIVNSLSNGNGIGLKCLIIEDPFMAVEVHTLDAVCSQLPKLEYLSIGFGDITGPNRPILTLQFGKRLDLTVDIMRWDAMTDLTFNRVEHLELFAQFTVDNLSQMDTTFPALKRLSLTFPCICHESPQMVYELYPKCEMCFAYIFDIAFRIESLVYLCLNGEHFLRRVDYIYSCDHNKHQ